MIVPTAPLPLQGAEPVPGMDLVVLLFVAVVGLLLALGIGYWVYRDASRSGKSNAGLWAAVVGVAFLVALLPGLIAFGAYWFLGRSSGSGAATT